LENTPSNSTDDEVRHLSKFGRYIDRLLELDDTLCKTIYPDDAIDEVSFPANSTEAQKEPEFTVGIDPYVDPNPGADDDYIEEIVDETVSNITTDDGDYVIAPGGTRSDAPPKTPRYYEHLALSEAEIALFNSLVTPDETSYEVAEDAVPSTADQDTIAYVLTLTGHDDTEYISGTELYETSAVIKAQVCEITEESASNRQLGKTQKLRKLEEIGQLSAAEMDYTM
jgi:hypothetical protein